MENIKFWITFLTDKRYAFDFKIANLFMNDSLRTYMWSSIKLARNTDRKFGMPVLKDIIQLMYRKKFHALFIEQEEFLFDEKEGD